MVILIFPLLASSKRERLEQIGENRVFAVTTSRVKVNKQPTIHSNIGMVMILAIQVTHRYSTTISKQDVTVKYNQPYNRITKVSQIDTTKQ